MFALMAELFPVALYLLHVVCAGLALAAAMVANVFGLSVLLLVRPVRAAVPITTIHHVMKYCLAGLWLTGLALVMLKFTPATVPVPVFYKLALATVLCINAMIIGQKVGSSVSAWPRPAALHFNANRLAGLIACTSLSLACWISAFAMATNETVRASGPLEFLGGFALLWLVLAATATMLVSARILFEAVVEDRVPGARPARQPVAALHLVPPERPAEHAAATRAQAPQTSARKPAPSMSGTLRSCASALAGIFAISLVTNLLMLTGPLFMLQIYDRVLTSRSIPTLTALLVLVAGLFVFLGVLELLRSRVLVRVGQRVDRKLNDTIFRHVVSVSPAAVKPGRQRLLQDLDSIRQFFGSSAPSAIFDLPWTPLYFAVIFMFHWVLGVLAIAGAAVLFLISLCNEFASRRPVALAGEYATRCASLVEAGRRNAEVLHAMGMFEGFRQRWLDVHRAGIAHHLRAADVAGTMSVISKVTRLFLQSLMLAAGAYYAVAGEISPGVIVAASIILSRALAPVEQIVGQWRNILTVRQGYGRLSRALAENEDGEQRLELPEPKGILTAERLYAGPLGSREPILKDLNFHVMPGEAVAVVGSNGSGKSTLARILVGVWPVLRGHIRLDGAALAQWRPEQLGKSVGYLPQDVELFEGTVAENIARFDPEASPQMIVEAARKAHVHDLILRLPEGYGTRLGEGGVKISGGQRQRIALARALYGDPSLVVLDEPNANLDSEGELALTAAIMSLRDAGKTVVVMAHRPNVLSAVDLVLVLKDGRQVSFGKKSQAFRQNVSEVNPKQERRNNAKPETQVLSAV